MFLVAGIGKYGKYWLAWLENPENGAFTGRTIYIDTWKHTLHELPWRCRRIDEQMIGRESNLLLVARLDGSAIAGEILELADRLKSLPIDTIFIFAVPAITNIEVADMVLRLSERSVGIGLISETKIQQERDLFNSDPCGDLQQDIDFAMWRKINGYCAFHGVAHIV